jgi:hypothetical protein
MKTVLSVLLSATMALPMPAIAKNEAEARPGVTEDVPVIAEEVIVGGQRAMMLVAPVDQAHEERFVSELAKNRPDDTILMVAGSEDPALKAAARTGFLKRIKTFILGKAEQAPLVTESQAPRPLKQKLADKIKNLSAAAKSDTAVGLYFAFAYSAIQGGFTAYASSSVDAGLAVFSMFSLWNAFVLTKPTYWGKVLDVGGRAAVSLGEKIAGLCGVEMSETDKRIYEVVGKFAMSWTVTSLQGAYVKEWAGDFQGLHGWRGFAEGFADSSVSGVQNNYNIWDAAVLKNNASGGYFTEHRTKWYFRWQMVVGAVMESLAFRGVPYVGLFLTAVTGAGAVYLALNPEKQIALNRQAMKFSVSFRSGVAYISNPGYRQQSNGVLQRRVAGGFRRTHTKCAGLLSSKPQNEVYFNRRFYEDTQ